MIKSTRNFMACAVLGISAAAGAGDYSDDPKARAFIDMMVTEHGFDANALAKVLDQAEKKQNILDAIARPAEKTKPWYEYREIFLGQSRIDQGVAFWQENRAVLEDVSAQYGVEPEIIVAIIGVETRYGKHAGSYRVIDALTTLGFSYPPRSKFFASELEQFFLLAREQQKNPLELMGSYAGAMGYGQFIPSSYRHYARDYDGDGFVDIWQNKGDAIASVANYFKVHGWQTGAPVFAPLSGAKVIKAAELDTGKRPSKTLAAWAKEGVTTSAKLSADTKATALEYMQPNGPEYVFGLHNFYVITRYNRSQMYARAVYELSQEILKGVNKASAQ